MIKWTVTDQSGFVLRSGYAGDEVQARLQALQGEVIHLGLEAPAGSLVRDGNVVKDAPTEQKSISTLDVKTWQQRLLSRTDWAIARAADPTDGRPIPVEIVAERQAIRAAAERLEVMDPIPPDYREAHYWQ